MNSILTKLKIYVILFAGIFYTETTILFNQGHKQMRKKIKWHIFILYRHHLLQTAHSLSSNLKSKATT